MSNVQCPVCTLFLLPGMSMEAHLETHPKEQVIKALVSCMVPKTEIVEPSTTLVDTIGGYRNSIEIQPTQIYIPQIQSTPKVFINRDTKFAVIQQTTIESGNDSVMPISPAYRMKHILLPPPPSYGVAVSQLASQSKYRSTANANSELRDTTNQETFSSASEENSISQDDIHIVNSPIAKERSNSSEEIHVNLTETEEKNDQLRSSSPELQNVRCNSVIQMNPLKRQQMLGSPAESIESDNAKLFTDEELDQSSSGPSVQVLSNVKFSPNHEWDLTFTKTLKSTIGTEMDLIDASSSSKRDINLEDEIKCLEHLEQTLLKSMEQIDEENDLMTCDESNKSPERVKDNEEKDNTESESEENKVDPMSNEPLPSTSSGIFAQPSTSRCAVMNSFKKEPKKLVVKFKKPFVVSQTNSSTIIEDNGENKNVALEKINNGIETPSNNVKDTVNNQSGSSEAKSPPLIDNVRTDKLIPESQNRNFSHNIDDDDDDKKKITDEAIERVRLEYSVFLDPTPSTSGISNLGHQTTDGNSLRELLLQNEPSTSQSQRSANNNMCYSSDIKPMFGIPNFTSYPDLNERNTPFDFLQDNFNWNQSSNQFVGFDNDRNSFIDINVYKHNADQNERSKSADSLMLNSDENILLKGERETNGDIDVSWPQEVTARYTNSYDTTIARESWGFSNDQQAIESNNQLDQLSSIFPKFNRIDSTDDRDTKAFIDATNNSSVDTLEKRLIKIRKFHCMECPKVFNSLRKKRQHLATEHNHLLPIQRAKATSTAVSSTSVSDTVGPSTSIVKTEPVGDSERINHIVHLENDTSLSYAKIKDELKRDNISIHQFLMQLNLSKIQQRNENIDDGSFQITISSLPDSTPLYKCGTCSEYFRSLKSFNVHLNVHPAQCFMCPKTFRHWVNLSVHLKRHLNIRDYECPHCDKKFVLRQNLTEHMNIHSGESPLKCNICFKRFKRYSNLIQHRNRHHLKIKPREKDYICYCGEVFHTMAKYFWHKETHDPKPKGCPYCRERFMHRNSLSRHVRLSHPEKFASFKGETLNCPICQKQYVKSSLKIHMARHQVKTQYECSICNKSFTTKWNLKQHKWIHASRSSMPFKCNLCSKAFVRENEFTSHMNAHKSIKPFTCDFCGCKFTRKYTWIRHTKEHQTPKQYRCDECGKEFHRAYYLSEHQRSHTGERPFECVICGKTSTTKTNHNKHIKIHHARDLITAES